MNAKPLENGGGEADAIDALQRSPLFAGLRAAALKEVASRCTLHWIPRGASVFRQGEEPKGWPIVVSGGVQLHRRTRNGHQQVVQGDGVLETVGDLTLFEERAYVASAIAVTDTRVLLLPRQELPALYSRHPEIASAVIHAQGRQIRRMARLIEKLSVRDVVRRVAMTLLEYADAAGAVLDGGEFALPRTQEQLAAELATTRETVARSLARLRRERVITQSGRLVRIDNTAALERLAHGE